MPSRNLPPCKIRNFIGRCKVVRHIPTAVKLNAMTDGEFLGGWWGFYPLGRHARVTIPVDFAGPNILLMKVVPVGGIFWLLEPCVKKHPARPALTWTAFSTIIRSRQQALGNLTNEWTPGAFWGQYLCCRAFSLNHLSYGFMVSCVHHRYVMKDGEVRDGWWGLCPLGRHARIMVSCEDFSIECWWIAWCIQYTFFLLLI